jgi:predicted NUDIX family phosphoesterase
MGKADEEVLVVSAARFRIAGEFHGFRPYDAAFHSVLLDPAHFSFRPRSEVETDPDFKQLIPYAVLRCRNEIFQYRRGAAGSETRLQSLRSIGIGGHICKEDASNVADPYRNGMLRELNEEVVIDCNWSERAIGFIYDDRTPVGSVHIGIVHVIDLEKPLARPRESAIDDAGFMSIVELRGRKSELETWSQFAFEAIENLA